MARIKKLSCLKLYKPECGVTENSINNLKEALRRGYKPLAIVAVPYHKEKDTFIQFYFKGPQNGERLYYHLATGFTLNHSGEGARGFREILELARTTFEYKTEMARFKMADQVFHILDLKGLETTSGFKYADLLITDKVLENYYKKFEKGKE